MMTRSLVTADDLFRMPDDGFRHELVRGELKRMPLAGGKHGAVVARLAGKLLGHVDPNHLGLVFGGGFLLESNPDTVRAPDIAFVRQEYIPPSGVPEGYWPGAPDLVVEVVSFNDRDSEVDERVRAWLSAGTRMAWVVNPEDRTVAVYRSTANTTTLTENDSLEGEDIVPGFRCAAGDIFVY